MVWRAATGAAGCLCLPGVAAADPQNKEAEDEHHEHDQRDPRALERGAVGRVGVSGELYEVREMESTEPPRARAPEIKAHKKATKQHSNRPWGMNRHPE